MVKAGAIVFAPDDGGQVEILSHGDLLFQTVDDAANKISAVLSSPEKQAVLRSHLAQRSRAFSAESFIQESLAAIALPNVKLCNEHSPASTKNLKRTEQLAVGFAIVVATKDRPEDVRRLLGSLSTQTSVPDEIVLVDSSENPITEIINDFPKLKVKYMRHWPPSASRQRNRGIANSDEAIPFIGFVDDDTTFDPDAFEAMKRFWANADKSIKGAAFNLCNYPARKGGGLKRSWLTAHLGLYASKPGYVAKSGWQSIIPRAEQTHDVEWIPATAAIYRREALAATQFDEFYNSYSYLEDLDLSYTIGKTGKLTVIAEARYYHYPSAAGRISMRQFGQNEVRNRIYFVRKHGLSICRCYLGLTIRMGMTFISYLRKRSNVDLDRLQGNVRGMVLYAVRSFSLHQKTGTISA